MSLMEINDRSCSDEEEPKTMEEERENPTQKEEDEEVQQGEKVIDGLKSTFQSLSKPSPNLTPISGSSPALPAVPQLTIFYGGSVRVFDGIPEEKVMEIMCIAAAAVAITPKNVETDNASSTPPPQPNSAASVGSLLAQLCPSPKSTLCKIQAEFPIARRQSLQRFLEKRRDRLVSKNPYSSSGAMKAENDMKI